MALLGLLGRGTALLLPSPLLMIWLKVIPAFFGSTSKRDFFAFGFEKCSVYQILAYWSVS
jgi:hypothetical protein